MKFIYLLPVVFLFGCAYKPIDLFQDKELITVNRLTPPKVFLYEKGEDKYLVEIPEVFNQ